MCCIFRLEEEAFWTASWPNQQNDICAHENLAEACQNQHNDLYTQQRLRSAWASAQSDQSLCCALNG